MADLFTIENLMTLLVLTALETVLGFDNLLYISIEAKKVAPENQKRVRQLGMIFAIGMRIVLLFVVLMLIEAFQGPLFSLEIPFLQANFTGHSLIVLAGGAFLIHTALKEIFHMLVVHDLGDRDVPWSDAERYALLYPDARLLSTSGLGHHRILKSPFVIAAILRFLDNKSVGTRVIGSRDPALQF